MKRYILIMACLLISLMLSAQKNVAIFSVPNKITKFGRSLPTPQLVYEVDSAKLYILDKVVAATNTMADVFADPTWYSPAVVHYAIDSATFAKIFGDSAGFYSVYIRDSLSLAGNAELYFGADETITRKDANGLQTSGSWTLTGDTLFSAVVSTTGNILGLGTLNHLSGAGGGAATGVLTLSSNGTPQLILNDLDAADAQEPMWYFQSANNASKGILYMGYGDRSSGTTMTGYNDVMVVDASSFTLGSTIGAGTQNFYAGTIASDATVTAATTMSTGTNAGTSGQLNFIASDNDRANIGINTSDQIIFNAAGGGYWFDGKAGFGVTPTAFVDIFGNKTTSNLLYVSNDANATKDSTVVITPAGNMGIGTGSPGVRLEIAGALKLSANSAWAADATNAYIRKQTDNGLVLTGATGSAHNFAILTTGGTIILSNPTGTNNLALGGTIGKVGVGTNTPYHLLSSYKASPVWALTNTTVNLNVSSAAQAIDSSAIALDISGEPTIKGRASDGDASNIAWNTSDQITFNAASGGYLFDAVTIVPVVAITSTDTASANYPVGSMLMRITASDTSMWVKIRMTGVLSARWKKLTP